MQPNALSPVPAYLGRIESVSLEGSDSKFEALSKKVIQQLIAKTDVDLDRTIFILSTTKGNIGFLEEGRSDDPRIHLHETAAYLANCFGFKKHMVVSNACISGVMALLVGKRMIESEHFDHAMVVGADVLSQFIISGFQSLQALSPEQCRPFDAGRKGINLGECAAGVLLSSEPNATGNKENVWIAGGGLSNDANHISGPSRTGEELGFAIGQALEEAGIGAGDVDFISAHGTATLYNDEMEAKAFHLMNLGETPLNSFKGYYGHTLGAAGILETILSVHSLKEDELIPSAGFESCGVTKAVNVIKKKESRVLKTCLKTASGFGGCNAAIILQKE
ncbi:MAG TPA: beta-ketoacyl synthase N-terminal-like domain-containing protein, partial [Chryseolinea sp.]